MSDAPAAVVATPVAKKAKTPTKAKKVTKKVASHPTYGAMIAEAIQALKDRKGSSRQAILKYLVANYKIEAKTASVHLRQAFRRGVSSGALVQVKGSFKLHKADDKPKKEVKKSAVKKSPKKKTAAAKKPVAKKVVKKPAAAKKAKTVKKSPAKKPKAAKKTPTKKPAARRTPKKAAPKKK